VVRVLLASTRLSVHPRSRWKEYGEIFNQNLIKAKSINPANPGIYYLQKNSLYYTPKNFSGRPKNVLPYYVQVDSLYRQISIDSVEVMPSWGAVQNMQMLNMCKKPDDKK
jgi:hypothetical protein